MISRESRAAAIAADSVRLVAVALLLVSVLAGCAKPIDPALSRAVRVYAEALVPALRAETLEPLQAAATPPEVDRVRLYVERYHQERGQRIDPRLISQHVTSTETLGASSARVIVTEEWSVKYRDKVTGQVADKVDRVDHVTYQLVKVDGAWRVDSVTVK